MRPDEQRMLEMVNAALNGDALAIEQLKGCDNIQDWYARYFKYSDTCEKLGLEVKKIGNPSEWDFTWKVKTILRHLQRYSSQSANTGTNG